MIISPPSSYREHWEKGQRGWFLSSLEREWIIDLVKDFRWDEKRENWRDYRLLKSDRPAQVWEGWTEDIHWVFKAYRPRPWWRRLWNGWTYSRAFYNIWIANKFQQGGFLTPQPLAALSSTREGGSFLLLSYLENHINLQTYTSRLSRDSARANQLINSLAHWVASFHGQGLYHGDLKSVNILVKEKEKKRWEFWLIDLDGSSLRRGYSVTMAARDLSCLAAYISGWAMKRGLLRFASAYRKALGLKERKGQKVWRKTLHYLEKREKKEKSLPQDFFLPPDLK